MRRFLCVLWTRPKVEKLIHISITIVASSMRFGQIMDFDDPKVDLEAQGHRSKVKVTRSKNMISGPIGQSYITVNVLGQGSHESRSTVTWVKVKGHMG